MQVSKIWFPARITFLLPGAPEPFARMTPMRIDKGDAYDAEIQNNEDNPEEPTYLGDILSWHYDNQSKIVTVSAHANAIMRYGIWVMTGCSVHPVRTITDEEDVIPTEIERWKIAGLYINLATETKMKGAVAIDIRGEASA